MQSLEARLLRLEKHAESDALCTDPRCLHMEILRLARCVHGFPEYPLPPHPMNPEPYSLVEELSSLNRQPGESAEDYAVRMRPKPYVDPYFGPIPPRSNTANPTPERPHAEDS